MLGVANGAFFGLLLCAWLAIGLVVAATFGKREASPPDAQLEARSKIRKARKHLAALAIVTMVAIGIVAASLFRLHSWLGSLPYGSVFANLITISVIANLFDLVVIDGLLLSKKQPRFLALPRVPYFSGYSGFRDHLQNFLIKLMICFAASLTIAGLLEPTTRLIK